MNRFASGFQNLSKFAGLFGFVAGGVVLFGRLFHITLLQNNLPNWVSMHTNVAASFLLMGAALWFFQPESPSRFSRNLGRCCILASILSGLSVLRAEPNTAVSFLLIGLGLLFLDVQKKQDHRPSMILIMIASFISFFALIGYMYGAQNFYRIVNCTPMSFHTAALFLILSFGTLSARPDHGIMAIALSDSPGGIMMRRLSLLVIFLPLFLGWMRFDSAMVVALNTVILTYLIVKNGRLLHGIHIQRTKVEEDLHQKAAELENSNASLKNATQELKDSKKIAISILEDTDETNRQLEKLQGELRLLNLTLEQKVEERTGQLRQAQQKLIQSEKMAALGQLAGAVAHEIRNPLSGLINSSYFLGLCEGEIKNRDILKNIVLVKKEVHLIEQLVANLLDFARTKEVEKVPTDLASLMEEILDNFPPPIGIKIFSTIPRDIPFLSIDPLMIGRVFGNLIINAYQAMPKGGDLKIEVKKSKDNFLDIIFEDSGVGIAKENLDKIFEPLFSTRNKGTGLGLAICKEVVQKHGGFLKVESELGKGAKFIVQLPLEFQ